MTDLKPILDLVSSGGIVALLIIMLLGGARQWWVFGWQYEQMRDDRDRWRELALHGSDLASRAVDSLTRR
jgi:hypothetical protein